MGGIRQTIKVDGRDRWTLFDTGARNTYVVPAVADLLITSETRHPIRTALEGGVKETNRTALLQAEVEGHLVSTHAMVVDQIGADEAGRPIEILFDALAMQQWGIRPVPDEDKLGLTHYPEEFIEFWSYAEPASEFAPGGVLTHLLRSSAMIARSMSMMDIRRCFRISRRTD